MTSETTGGTTTVYEYDPNGALTKSDDGTTVKAYAYDYEGYLTAFDTTGEDNDATYTYDADKRRIAKTLTAGTTKYFLDGANVIADYDGDNTLVATYVTPALDDNVSQTRSGSTYYYTKDGLASIRNLVDSNEATQNTYDYYAFGRELGSWTENVTNRYTYTAREYDSESAQYYYRARYYGAAGRFLGRDAAMSSLGLYVYVSNRPATGKDPRGLQPTGGDPTRPVLKDRVGRTGVLGHWCKEVLGAEWEQSTGWLGERKNIPTYVNHNIPYRTMSGELVNMPVNSMVPIPWHMDPVTIHIPGTEIPITMRGTIPDVGRTWHHEWWYQHSFSDYEVWQVASGDGERQYNITVLFPRPKVTKETRQTDRVRIYGDIGLYLGPVRLKFGGQAEYILETTTTVGQEELAAPFKVSMTLAGAAYDPNGNKLEHVMFLALHREVSERYHAVGYDDRYEVGDEIKTIDGYTGWVEGVVCSRCVPKPE